MPEGLGQVVQSRFTFTVQHLSITLDMTRGLEKVAIVSSFIKCNPTSCLS